MNCEIFLFFLFYPLFNIYREKLNYNNLIIYKDLFLHLSFVHIEKILQNIINTKCKYFAVSRYDNGKYKNIDQDSGLGARSIEITTTPFNFNYNIIKTIKYSKNHKLLDELIIFKM